MKKTLQEQKTKKEKFVSQSIYPFINFTTAEALKTKHPQIKHNGIYVLLLLLLLLLLIFFFIIYFY